MVALVVIDEAVRYCERGAAPQFWAEPVNAATNAVFLLAALGGYTVVRASRLSSSDRRALIASTAVAVTVGVGSAAFHTAPSPLTKLADVVPIAVFVVGAVYLALHRLFGCSLAATLGWLGALGLASAAVAGGARTLGCDGATCLNGAPGYLPVLVAMTATALAAWCRRSAAAPSLALAGLVFALALTARTLDLAVCPLATLGPITLTAHAFWHLGTALAAYLVLRGLARGLTITS